MASLSDFARDLTRVVVTSEVLAHEAMEKACKVVETEAKRVIGTYDYHWPELAESTKEDRARHGFPEDEPLLRTGDLRDSIQHNVGQNLKETVGIIGSDNPKAVWQFLGTRRIPPRDALGTATFVKEHEICEILGGHISEYMKTLG